MSASAGSTGEWTEATACLPNLPNVPDDRRVAAEVPLRFEDITQDGRLGLVALTAALGDVAWRQLLARRPHVPALAKLGIAPVLSRLVVEARGGPFSTEHPIASSAAYDFAHAARAGGDVDRLIVNVWADATLPIGRSFGRPPANAGERALAGRLFGEHVLTRPFAPPDARRVTEVASMPFFPGARVAPPPADAVLRLPDGAVPLDEAPRKDGAPIVVGLSHTDGNQHVNTLVYPRLFEQAALRRFAELGAHKPPLLARAFEAAFRKPCVAGETYAIVLQAYAYEDGRRLGAVGAFVSESDAARPHAFLRMAFER